MKTICVYCSSSNVISSVYRQEARRLGELIAGRGWNCLNGGGNRGLMIEVSEAVMACGGVVIGVAPRFMVEEGWVHNALTRLHVVETMHERKQLMVSESDAVIALPGGVGTLEELMEVITWKQLGLFFGPIVILNTNGYYDCLIRMLAHAIGEGFVGEVHGQMWRVVDTSEEAMAYIQDAPEWIKDPKRIAALG